MVSKTNSMTERWADWANLVLALALFSAPWCLGFTGQTWLARNDWIVGASVAMLAVAALTNFQNWEEWINVALGLWTVASPWIFGVTALTTVLWAHVALGALIAGLAAWRTWSTHSGAALTV